MRFITWLAAGLVVYTTYGLRHIVYNGRLRRFAYLLGLLVTGACEVVLLLGVRYYMERSGADNAGYFTGAVIVVAGIAAKAILSVRRLHDLDRPGRRYWLLWIPLFNIIYFLDLLLRPGTPGPNQYDAVAVPLRVAAAGAPLPPDFNPEQQLPEPDVHDHDHDHDHE